MNLEIVLGSFYGDEAKGMCVNNLCLKSRSREKTLVVRFSGGPQVGHNVKHGNLEHCFSNYGSGTLLQIPTFWSRFCLLDPITSELERTKLRTIGIEPTITYDPKCEIIVPFDVWNQWGNQENREHGTVGVGIKSALDRIKNGYHLTILDARNIFVLREKIKSIQDNYYKITGTLPTSKFTINDWIEAVHKYATEASLKSFSEIASKYNHLIFEGSQGILLDQTYGIMPYCTPADTTSKNALTLIDELNLPNQLIKIYYVCRPYITRHGNGPLCCPTPILNIEDINNQYNEYQKSFRSCEFDLPLLQHSLEIDKLSNEHHKYLTKKYIVFSHGNELNPELEEKVKKECNLKVLKFEYETWL